MIRIIFVVAIVLSNFAYSFPELVRKGYGNCVTCHVSPTGGGTLTEYGRSLIPEVLTTTGSEKSANFLHGAVNLPKWLLGGGDIRTTEFYNSANATKKFTLIFPMQLDMEAAVVSGNFTFDATLGMDYYRNPISRRFFAMYHVTDELAFRAGRFMPSYGINTEMHTIAIKRGLGKDEGMETMNLEASYISENYDVFLTAIAGRPDAPSVGAEKGVAVSSSVFFADRFKTGMSFYYGYHPTDHRTLAGPFAMLGITPRLYVLAELDAEWASAMGGFGPSSGIVDDVRIGYEVMKGINVYVVQEYSALNNANPNMLSQAYGIGAQFFPMPHLEFNTLYQRQSFGTFGFSDYAFIMAHYYF